MKDDDESVDAAGKTDPAAEASTAAGVAPACVPEGRVRSEHYGMHYDPRNSLVVERARSVPDELWNEIPIEYLPVGASIEANEETLKQTSIDNVTSGAESFREGYVVKLWRARNGQLHVIDGHHRVAMYHALVKPMPVRIMDSATYDRLMMQGS